MPRRRASGSTRSRVNGARRTRRTHAGIKRHRKARVSRRRPMVRKRRRVSRKSASMLRKTEFGNIKTYTQQIADSEIIVPPPSGTGFDTYGMSCAYITTGTGLNQAIPETRPLLGYVDLQKMAANISQGDVPAYGPSIGPGVAIPGSTTAPGIGGANQTKYQIIDGFHKYELVNSSNSQCYVDMYYCKARRDLLYQYSYTNVLTYMNEGFYQRGDNNNQPTSNAFLDQQVTPFDSTKFCQSFKIYKTERVCLDGGCTLMRTIKTGPRHINWARYSTYGISSGVSTNTRDFSHIAGERFIMFKFYGTPASIATTVGNPSSNVTYTTPRINMITTIHYNFRSVNPQQPLLIRDTAQGFNQLGTNQFAEIVNNENGIVSQFVDA